MADEDVRGLQELLKDLEQLPFTLRKTLIVRALRDASEPIEALMIATAPDNPKTPGNRIAKNIDTNVTDQTATGAASYIGFTKGGFMAGFAERGTKHQRKTPFMVPAFDAKVKEAGDIMAEVLGDGIVAALKK